MTSINNSLFTALFGAFGLSSVVFGVKAFVIESVQNTGLNAENSIVAVIFSIVGALLTALVKFMSFIKDANDNIKKNTELQEKLLEAQNKTLEIQNKTLEIQGKILESQTKMIEVMNTKFDDTIDALEDSSVSNKIDRNDRDRSANTKKRPRSSNFSTVRKPDP